jgi:hypothetical protein
MSPIEQPQSAPPVDEKNRLVDILGRLLPLVDGVSDKVRFIALLGVGLDIWIFIALYLLMDVSLLGTLIVTGLALLPILLLLRFWWALEELKALPDTAERMMSGVKGEIREEVRRSRGPDRPNPGVLGSAKSLWSIGAMAAEVRDLAGSYIGIGTLANPLSLILGVLSMLFVFVLGVVAMVLLLVVLL